MLKEDIDEGKAKMGQDLGSGIMDTGVTVSLKNKKVSLLFPFHQSTDDQKINHVWRRIKAIGLSFPAVLLTNLGSGEFN